MAKVHTLQGLRNVTEDYHLGVVQEDDDGQLIIRTGRKVGADGRLYPMDHMPLEGKTIESVERRDKAMFIKLSDKTCLAIEVEHDGRLSVSLEDPNRGEQ